MGSQSRIWLGDWTTTTLLSAVRFPLWLISRLKKKRNQNFQSNKLDWTFLPLRLSLPPPCPHILLPFPETNKNTKLILKPSFTKHWTTYWFLFKTSLELSQNGDFKSTFPRSLIDSAYKCFLRSYHVHDTPFCRAQTCPLTPFQCVQIPKYSDKTPNNTKMDKNIISQWGSW